MKIKRDKADLVFSQYIRLRDGECLRCHSKVELNDQGLPITHSASHFWGRAKESVRFDPVNLCCLCTGCHMYFTAHPAVHSAWQLERLGQKDYDALRLRAHTFQRKDRAMALIIARELLKTVYDAK